jgi:hypothetical protein
MPEEASRTSCRRRLSLCLHDLARAHGSEITLVHVSELQPNLPPDTLVSP